MQQEACSPLFRVLGYYRAYMSTPRYYFEVNGEIRGYRGWELRGVPFLLDLYPYHDHWRSLFPKPPGRRIDVHASSEWFIRACNTAGVFEPPEHLKPLGRGRPRKTA